MDEGPEAALWRELVALYRNHTPMSPYSEISTRDLHEKLLRYTKRMSGLAMCQTDAESYVDAACDDLVVSLTAHVYEERILESVRVPADWLEAVKERFAPAWLLRRYPMRYREIGAEMFARYPEIHGQGPCVRVMEWKQPLMRAA